MDPQKNNLVLIVDDDRELGALLARRLPEPLFHVRTVDKIADFFSAFAGQEPDLCIVDLNIERPLDGLEVIQQIRARQKGRPRILVLSAEEGEYTVVHAVEMGADDYMIKPPPRHDFIERCHALIESKAGLAPTGFFDVTDAETRTRLSLSVEVLAVDDDGVKVRSTALIPKGTQFRLACPLFSEILGTGESELLMNMVATWVEPEVPSSARVFGGYAEFDPDRHDVLSQVRKWVLNQKAIKAPGVPSV